MAEPFPAVLVEDEHDLYPVHEEDSVPETPRHFWQVTYLAAALQSHLPGLWVTGDTCLYWERGDKKRYVAPDVSVIACPPPPEPKNVYLAWSDPPLLFVVEVGSRSTLAADTGPKVETFERLLAVPEYLYADPPRGDLRLWRMVNDRYTPVPREADGRVWSAQLEVWFGYDAQGFLRAYTPTGTMLLTHEEERSRRAEAEQRAQSEAAARAEAERRLTELTAELERLRRSVGTDPVADQDEQN